MKGWVVLSFTFLLLVMLQPAEATHGPCNFGCHNNADCPSVGGAVFACESDNCPGLCLFSHCSNPSHCYDGTSCGPCAPSCPADADCTGRTCGPDPVCGESCGTCSGDQACQTGGNCGGCQIDASNECCSNADCPWNEPICRSPGDFGFCSCVDTAGDQCNRNACGGTGTVECDGSCSAAAPPVPSNLGAACNRNACGGTGVIVCDGTASGTCSAAAPPVPSNLGAACNRNACGGTGVIVCDGTASGTCSAAAPPCGSCTPGQERDCGTNVGVCEYGIETCNAGGNWPGTCVGGVNPGIEVCGNSLDEDCNGVAETCAPACPDGTCNGAETCSTCPQDCGVCGPTCNDGTCNGAETCSTCPQDCGVCSPTQYDAIGNVRWDCNSIRGWLCDENDPDRSVQYRIYRDGAWDGITRTTSNPPINAGDAAAIAGQCGGTVGTPRFWFATNSMPGWADGNSHDLTVLIRNINADGSLSPWNQGDWAAMGAPRTNTCAPPSYSCTGSIAPNGVRHDAEEETGLTANTPWTHAFTDTPTKCQFECDTNNGYRWNGAACELSNIVITNCDVAPGQSFCWGDVSWSPSSSGYQLRKGSTTYSNPQPALAGLDLGLNTFVLDAGCPPSGGCSEPGIEFNSVNTGCVAGYEPQGGICVAIPPATTCVDAVTAAGGAASKAICTPSAAGAGEIARTAGDDWCDVNAHNGGVCAQCTANYERPGGIGTTSNCKRVCGTDAQDVGCTANLVNGRVQADGGGSGIHNGNDWCAQQSGSTPYCFKCDSGYMEQGGTCVPVPVCGDGTCNGAETQANCCHDCGCSGGQSCLGGPPGSCVNTGVALTLTGVDPPGVINGPTPAIVPSDCFANVQYSCTDSSGNTPTMTVPPGCSSPTGSGDTVSGTCNNFGTGLYTFRCNGFDTSEQTKQVRVTVNQNNCQTFCSGGTEEWIGNNALFEAGTTPNCCALAEGEYYDTHLIPSANEGPGSVTMCCNGANDCAFRESVSECVSNLQRRSSNVLMCKENVMLACSSSRNSCGAGGVWNNEGTVGSPRYCGIGADGWKWRTTFPTELCGDGYDNDCDGDIDMADSDCGFGLSFAPNPAQDQTPAQTVTATVQASGGLDAGTYRVCDFNGCNLGAGTCVNNEPALAGCVWNVAAGTPSVDCTFTVPPTHGTFGYYACYPGLEDQENLVVSPWCGSGLEDGGDCNSLDFDFYQCSTAGDTLTRERRDYSCNEPTNQCDYGFVTTYTATCVPGLACTTDTCDEEPGTITHNYMCHYDNTGGLVWTEGALPAEDRCFDGEDNDCDGLIDCADPDCNADLCTSGTSGATCLLADTVGHPNEGNDVCAICTPGQDLCGDTNGDGILDDDCDGTPDEDCTTTLQGTVYFRDSLGVETEIMNEVSLATVEARNDDTKEVRDDGVAPLSSQYLIVGLDPGNFTLTAIAQNTFPIVKTVELDPGVETEDLYVTAEAECTSSCAIPDPNGNLFCNWDTCEDWNGCGFNDGALSSVVTQINTEYPSNPTTLNDLKQDIRDLCSGKVVGQPQEYYEYPKFEITCCGDASSVEIEEEKKQQSTLSCEDAKNSVVGTRLVALRLGDFNNFKVAVCE